MSDDNVAMIESDNEQMELDDNEQESEVFNPKKHKIDEDTELEMDESAYVLYHTLKVEHSCLSFDVIRDNMGTGEERSEKFPYTVYSISGSQATVGHSNILTVMKMNNLQKLKPKENSESDEESDDEESEDEFLDDKSELTHVNILHNGAVNRVRTHLMNNPVAASWSDLGQVHIWDLKNQIWAVNDSAYMADYMGRNEIIKPIYTIRNHSSEGYAMDWSSCKIGQLASGDNDGKIFVTHAKEHGFEVINQPLSKHTSSVEDIQWSPNQDNILISCSSDRSILVWDIRDMRHHVEMSEAHTKDVNVISWSKNCAFSLVSGGDEGIVKVWDLRMFKSTTQQAYTHLYDYHKDYPITSIEWCPQSQYVFACSSDDDQLTLWDISMEQDAEELQSSDEFPIHLLFNHMGQKEIKELHWHPQIPGLLLSTALDGMNVFKTISI